MKIMIHQFLSNSNYPSFFSLRTVTRRNQCKIDSTPFQRCFVASATLQLTAKQNILAFATPFDLSISCPSADATRTLKQFLNVSPLASLLYVVMVMLTRCHQDPEKCEGTHRIKFCSITKYCIWELVF